MLGTTRSRGGSSSRRACRRHQGSLLVPSTTDTPPRARANVAAELLLDRLAVEDLDLPDGSARLRLSVKDADEVDVLLDEAGGSVVPSEGRADALLSADAA